ncbi:unnamed protein product [Cuscuta europaea]|uniref:C2H2-type domain-containing protein n=1 Tax=Cuscuta europaea TaxID=41803 RepID=A0A9P0YRM9_CUSEU|nr:unnamed protein product [Cuscuta europaea]
MVELKKDTAAGSSSWREGKAAADGKTVEGMAMENCLVLLSRMDDDRIPLLSGGRGFECKTCRRQFHTFQALGGHRASHKKPRVSAAGEESRSKKLHKCSICGLEFDKGQSLGGHMSKHRAKQQQLVLAAAGCNGDGESSVAAAVVVKKQEEEEEEEASPSEAVVGPWDLNLTPLQNEHMLARASDAAVPAPPPP